MKSLVEKLKNKNLKVTPQRLAVYRYIYQTTQHPSAERIYRALEPENPALSLATVYKTLDAFKKSGLVQEINVGEDSFRYDANCRPHPHLICNVCHEVVDLPPIPAMEKIKQDIEADMSFQIEREQIYFFGVCKSCAGESVSRE